MKVHGKTIVVTGAGNGLGRELTLALLRRGARVAGVDLRPDGLAETGPGLPARAAHHARAGAPDARVLRGSEPRGAASQRQGRWRVSASSGPTRDWGRL